MVGKKGFDDHDNFQWNLENGQFIKKAFVLDSVESFLYVKNYRSGLYVIVIVFAKLMVGLVSSNEAECSFFGSDFDVQFFLQVTKYNAVIHFRVTIADLWICSFSFSQV